MHGEEQALSWGQYERRVFQLVQSAGHFCERNVVLKGVRAQHQIDVVVHPSKDFGKHVWIVECKHWARRVGKREVLAFRSTIEDLGADHGYIFSERGFQKGAVGFAATLNITLCNLRDTEERFCAQQLVRQHKQSEAFETHVVRIDEDKGNFDSEVVIELTPMRTDLAIECILEIHIFKEAEHWIIPRAGSKSLVNESGTLILRMPWDAIHLAGIKTQRERSWLTESGILISGGYHVYFRTLRGPAYIGVSVPSFK
jgi:hypothetical protein